MRAVEKYAGKTATYILIHNRTKRSHIGAVASKYGDIRRPRYARLWNGANGYGRHFVRRAIPKLAARCRCRRCSHESRRAVSIRCFFKRDVQ